MASGIITNNVRVAIACFAGGIFLGVGSLVLLGLNGLMIGAFAGHFANAGLLDYLLEFIVGHGAARAVRHLGRGRGRLPARPSVVAPGTSAGRDALVLSGRIAVRMVGATAVLLVVAGLIEGFVSAGGGGVGAGRGERGEPGFLALYLLNGAGAPAASGSELAQHRPHPDRQRLDLPEAGQRSQDRSATRSAAAAGSRPAAPTADWRVVPQLAEALGVGHVI